MNMRFSIIAPALLVCALAIASCGGNGLPFHLPFIPLGGDRGVAPDAPGAATVTPGNRQLYLEWESVEGAASYEVWYGTSSSSSLATRYGGSNSGTSCIIEDLDTGTTYYIWLKARNSYGTSAFGPVASGTPYGPAVPAAPGAATVTPGNGQLSLTWTAVSGTTYYEVWYNDENSTATASSYSTYITATTSTITGLANNTTYYMWLKARNSYGTSGFGPVASGTPSYPGRIFDFSFVEYGSDGNLYFSEYINTSYENGTLLLKWDIDGDTVTVIQDFTDPINVMASSDDKSLLYIGEGPRMWVYKCGDGTLTHVYNAPDVILGLYPAGDYIISNDTSGWWSTNRLLRKSDFAELDSLDQLWPSSTSVYSPVNSKVYLISDGVSPDDICYQEIDTVNDLLGDYDDSPYHGDYDHSHPIRLFPDETRVAVGSGIVFNTADLTYHGSLGYEYADLTFGTGGEIYLLHNLSSPSGTTRSKLLKLNAAYPYTTAGTLLNLTASGRRLLRDGDDLIIVTRDSGANKPITVSRHAISDLD
jgi:hypothetical protein